MHNSFILYTDSRQHIELLSDSDAGAMIKAVFLYTDTGEIQTDLSPAAAMAFSFIRAQIDRDGWKYEEVRRKRSAAGKLGALATNSKRSANSANAAFAAANSADNVPDNVPDTVPDTGKKDGDRPLSRHKYGAYKNVLFTDEEFSKLQAEYPTDYSERIERLSEYIASTGKSYKSHFATIKSWARKDRAKADTMPSYGGDENWSL